jgi:3-oxoacyl-[acyl-carrier protein] reductase
MSTKPPALITGATQGIGRATAFALARAGYPVGVCARTEAKVQALAADLTKEGFKAVGVRCDVGDADSVAAMVTTIESALGPIGVLINNAGIARLKPFDQLSIEDFDATMATNVRSLFLVTRLVLPGMRVRKSGDIVNVASLAGRNGFVGGTAYTASKHAVLGFSRSLMLEVRKENVRVIAICPGTVDTPMMQGQSMMNPRVDHVLQADDIAATILATLQLPVRAMVSELDIRPTDP